jgi:hypothetical protein
MRKAPLEKQLTAWVAGPEIWKVQESLLRTAPGVEPKTAVRMLAQLPELPPFSFGEWGFHAVNFSQEDFWPASIRSRSALRNSERQPFA